MDPALDEKLRQIIETSNVTNKNPATSDKVESDTKERVHESSDSIKQKSFSSTQKSDEASISFGERLKQEIRDKVDSLPSQREELQNSLTKTLGQHMDSLQQTIFKATRALNDVTGYSAIEHLKLTIEKLESDLKQAKEDVKNAKEAYSQAIQERSLLQKEINELLTRKHNWSQQDLERFTELYRNDHVNEQAEISAQQQLSEAEQLVDSIQLKLTQLILTRYHEEQIWSDKIRRASTWGTWFLMGFNIMLFFIATFIVEPWKRNRMVGSFEQKVKLAIREYSQELLGKMDQIITNQGISYKTEESPSPKVYGLRLPKDSWRSFYTSLVASCRAFWSPQVEKLEIGKVEFGVIITGVSFLTGMIGSLITVYFYK